MDDGGYIIVYRSFMRSDWWTREPFTRGQAWIDMLGLARFKDGHDRIHGVRVDLKRGQLLGCHTFLKNRWKWKSRKKVATFLNELTKEQLISQGNEQPNQYAKSIITILNYDSIQLEVSAKVSSEDQPEHTEGTPKEQPRNSQGTHLNNGYKGNNGNRINPTFDECMQKAAPIGMTHEMVRAFYDYYSPIGWKKGKAGHPITDLHAALTSWKNNDARMADRSGSSTVPEKKEPPANIVRTDEEKQRNQP